MVWGLGFRASFAAELVACRNGIEEAQEDVKPRRFKRSVLQIHLGFLSRLFL